MEKCFVSFIHCSSTLFIPNYFSFTLHLSDIDFGHFLGNYKKKFGFKRERAPFVFTPDFAYVMGGKDSKDFMKFVDLCCKAYNILRKYANVFINLFAMVRVHSLHSHTFILF
jgi:hypothetical protein